MGFIRLQRQNYRLQFIVIKLDATQAAICEENAGSMLRIGLRMR